METTSTARERIFAAADLLYRESGHQTMPTVDAVRKLAKVNMNDASTGMREWRRAQATQVPPMSSQAPDTLQRSNAAALAALWSEAVSLANETLRAAEQSWAAERAEAETLREQMAKAYEAQCCELEAAQSELAQLRIEQKTAVSDAASLGVQMETMRHDLEATTASAKQADARATEIERRANDLRAELDHAHRLLDESASALSRLHTTHADAVATLQAELAQQRQNAAREADAMRSDLAQARETAASLRGKLDALAEPLRFTEKKARRSKSLDGDAAE